MNLKMIAFDADDTLWHNETLYHRTQERYKRLLSKYIDPIHVDEKLYQTEIKNLPYFGYGIKSFTLSMIETAGQLTDGCISAQDLLQIVRFSKDMLDAPIELLPGVQDVVSRLSNDFDLMIITKGDLLDQKRKLSRSGLEQYFKWVEIVIDKTPEVYADLLAVHHIEPTSLVMIGNSLRSDILPVLSLGSPAVYIPYQLTWAHEHDIDHLTSDNRYYELNDISSLPDLIYGLTNSG
jgi:putative hydrolase of the HAD superfamily